MAKNKNQGAGDTLRKQALSSNIDREAEREFPLGRRNFKFMIVAAVMIVGGFLLMLGGSSTSEFNPDIFSARRIVVGPGIAFLGFVFMAIAIILKPKGLKH